MFYQNNNENIGVNQTVSTREIEKKNPITIRTIPTYESKAPPPKKISLTTNQDFSVQKINPTIRWGQK